MNSSRNGAWIAPILLLYINSEGRLTVNELSDDQFYPGFARILF